MKRIDTVNRGIDLLGAGKDGFQSAAPGISDPTYVNAKWFNAVQEAIVRTIEAAGLSPSDTDYNQFKTALTTLFAPLSLVANLANAADPTQGANLLGHNGATVRAALVAAAAQIAALQAGQAAGVLGYATLTAINADLAHAAGTIGYVTNDATPANNTVYLKLGASGAGSWQVSSASAFSNAAVAVSNLAASIATEIEQTDGKFTDGTVPVAVIEDPNGAVSAWCDSTGEWHFPALPGLTVAGRSMDDTETDPAWLLAYTGTDDKIVFGIKIDGSLYLGPGSTSGGAPQNQYTDLLHIVLHGQSLGEGADSLPIVSSSDSRWGSLQFARGVRTWSATDNAITPQSRAASDFAFTPLTARSSSSLGETIANGMADGFKAGIAGRYALTTQVNVAPRVLVSFAARGGTGLTELNVEDTGRTDGRDTNAAPGGFWLTMLDDVARAKASAAAQGWSHAVAGMMYMQGEHDATLKVYEWESPRVPSDFNATWKGKFKLMADQADTAIRAITGQPRRVPFFTYQTANNITGNAQLEAEAEHNDIIMVGPTYMVPPAFNSSYLSGSTQVYGAAIHLTADGQRWFGEQCAKVMRRTLLEKEQWRPLRPLAARKVDAITVDVDFFVPRLPLVLDTAFLPKCIGWGFCAYGGTLDARGTRCDVSNMQVIGNGSTVRFTFSSNLPAGAFMSAGNFSTCDLGTTPAVASVGAGPTSAGGFPQFTLTLTGDLRATLKPLSDEGAFYLYATNASGTIRSVALVGGNTVLTGETRELRTGGAYRAFLAGDVLSFGRGSAFTNLRDSDDEAALNVFASTAYGTRAGQRYPLWNWAALFDNFPITGA